MWLAVPTTRSTATGGNWIVISTTHTNPAISGDTFVHYQNTVTNSDLYVAENINVTGFIERRTLRRRIRRRRR